MINTIKRFRFVQGKLFLIEIGIVDLVQTMTGAQQ